MAAVNGLPPPMQRIPAWKRIGLRLKYAKEDTTDHSTSHDSTSAASVETLSRDQVIRDSSENGRPSKKRRTVDQQPNEPQTTVATASIRQLKKPSSEQASRDKHTFNVSGELSRDNIEHEISSVVPTDFNFQSDHVPASTNRSKSVARRKSVTFTPETKQDDGFSASTLFEQQTTVPEAASEELPNSQRPTKAEKKKAKRQEARAKGPQPQSRATPSDERSHQTSTDGVPEYVRYLEQFHIDRAAWKFNKNKQNDLLKNLFNLDCVPAKHDEAILQYIEGLNGKGPRQRIIEAATSVLKDISEKQDDFDANSRMESDIAKREAYLAALQRHLDLMERAGVEHSEYDDQQWQEMQEEAARGRRADVTLRTLLVAELYPNETPSAAREVPQASPTRTITASTTPTESTTRNSTPQSNSTTQSKTISNRKKRKARTQSTQSADSSSESEGGYKPSRGPATVHAALSRQPDTKTNEKWDFKFKPTGSRKIFDDDLLDQMFPKEPNYHEKAPKRKAGEARKARGFAYTHGTRVDESGSEDE